MKSYACIYAVSTNSTMPFQEDEITANSSQDRTSNITLVCSEQFFFDENDTQLCRPICGEFNQKSTSKRVIDLLAACVGLIAAVGVVIIALTVQRKEL